MDQYTNRELFKLGEDIATTHLLSSGYKLICRNYRKVGGEIDVIVEKNQRLIFCEVKTRTSHSLSTALASVSYHKQQRITKTALIYINENPQYGNYLFRFDVLVVFYYPQTETFSVKHFEDAFLPVVTD
jgi:putative endonuclease